MRKNILYSTKAALKKEREQSTGKSSRENNDYVKTTRTRNSNKQLRANHALKAYQGIRQMLFYNEITPGQKLAYRDLAERLKMSLTPVIQALKLMEFQGLVRYEPNRGYYTEPICLQEVQEIYDLRLLLEISLIPEAVNRLDEKGIISLKTALDEHTKAVKTQSFNQRLVEDRNFHIALASLSNARIPIQMLRSLFDLLYLKYGGAILFRTFMGVSDNEHSKIFEAVISKNIELTQEILSAHINNVKNILIGDITRHIVERKENFY